MQGKQKQLNASKSLDNTLTGRLLRCTYSNVVLQYQSLKKMSTLTIWILNINMVFVKKEDNGQNNYKNNTDKYLKLKSLSSSFLSPILQTQLLALVSLNHFVVSVRKCDRVLGDAPSCCGWSPSPGTSLSQDTCYLPAPQEQMILNTWPALLPYEPV